MPIIIEGEGRVPVKEDVAVAQNQVLFRTQLIAPKTLEIIKEREREEEERQRKFRDESELLQPLQTDFLGILHVAAGEKIWGKAPLYRGYDADYRHEHPRKSSWGERRQKLADRAQEILINRALVDAEIEDRE